MSSMNSFRNLTPSEEAETIAARPSSPPLPALPQRTASPKLPALPPRPSVSGPSSQPAMPASSSHGTTRDTASQPTTLEDIDDDDLPPPYTPAANVSMGEETLDLGPRRPFQSPPAIQSSSLHPLSGSRLHSNWPPPSAQPLQPFPTGPSSGFPGPRPGSAPWQTQQQYRQRQNGGGGLLGALFDTVRDIADVVSGAHDERVMAAQRTNAGAYAIPYSNTGTVYASPPGPPPRMPQSPPPRPASTPPRSPPSTVPDDGSPTRTPVPGHPLLRDGKLLVYPRNYLCVKCKNTGYKNYDPSHPCRKCWEKYGRSYTGALMYTPWSSSGNDPKMQRPLPKFVPPHLAGLNPGSSSGSARMPQPQHLHHSRSVSQPHYVHSPGSGPSYYVLDPLSPGNATPPVPHAITVAPGDPRLGGSLCMRCGGDGMRMVMLIDLVTCDNCGGTGRVWR